MIAGIVLAAGKSVRMGTLKPLLPLGGKTVIEIVIERVRSRLERVVVVLGHQADEVLPVLGPYPVECLVNPDYVTGMLSSVQCGIRALGEVEGCLICLADQPGITPQTMDSLLQAATVSGQGILIPTYQGRRGHPVLLKHPYALKVLALSPEQGLDRVTRGYPGDTLEVAVDSREILEDMDTPADYQREQSKYRI